MAVKGGNAKSNKDCDIVKVREKLRNPALCRLKCWISKFNSFHRLEKKIFLRIAQKLFLALTKIQMWRIIIPVLFVISVHYTKDKKKVDNIVPDYKTIYASIFSTYLTRHP